MVDFSKPGKYIVTLNAENDMQKGAPVQVTVIVEGETPVPDPTPTPDPTPDPDPTPNPDPTPSPTPSPTPNPVDVTPSVDKPVTPIPSIPSLTVDEKKETTTSVKTAASTNALPKTGDSLPVAGVTVGALLIGLSWIVSRRNKKSYPPL